MDSLEGGITALWQLKAVFLQTHLLQFVTFHVKSFAVGLDSQFPSPLGNQSCSSTSHSAVLRVGTVLCLPVLNVTRSWPLSIPGRSPHSGWLPYWQWPCHHPVTLLTAPCPWVPSLGLAVFTSSHNQCAALLLITMHHVSPCVRTGWWLLSAKRGVSKHANHMSPRILLSRC